MLQRLFALTIAVLNTTIQRGTNRRLETIQVNLMSTTCKTLKTIQQFVAAQSSTQDMSSIAVERDRREYGNCFCTCVSLITSLVARPSSSNTTTHNEASTYMAKQILTLKSLDVIRSLVFQVDRSCTLPGTQSITHDMAGQTQQMLVLFKFLTEISALGDTLDLLFESEASILFKNIILSDWAKQHSSTSEFPQRGYLPVGSKGGIEVSSGHEVNSTDDPTHEVWRACLQFIASALRSSNGNSRVSYEAAEWIHMIALEFLSTNFETLIVCLKQITASKDFMLTINVLREASLILSIISELCTYGAVDSFKRVHEGLYDNFIRESKALVVRLSIFLGASASSREIFRAMADFESTDGTAVNPGILFALNPVHHVLASGLPNPQHEAVRYSKIASRSTTAMTPEEKESRSSFPLRWKKESEKANHSPRSVSSLKYKSRASVTCDYSFFLERAAAECLFFAGNFLFRTHPAASAFIRFSEQEVSQLDAMSLVKPGMVIAFRTKGPEEKEWDIVTAPVTERNCESVSFGQVLKCDTLNQKWAVRFVGSYIGNYAEECWVPASKFAGIEDMSKRRCILSYAPAPETSSELENAAGKSISVGHLILCLRWCHQTRTEIQKDETCTSTDLLVGRLSDMLTALIGAEMSIHREIRSERTVSREDATVLSCQLLDLFAEETELPEVYGEDGIIKRDGKLKKILREPIWNNIRCQLRPELDRAINETESNSGGRNNLVGEALRYNGIRHKQSPFR